MFNPFRKLFSSSPSPKSAPAWKDLTANQRATVARKIHALMGGARYKIVSGTDTWQRERGMTEWRDEDEILNVYGRGHMIDLARNATRNSSTWNGILKQIELNVIGNGGKAILDFDEDGKTTDEFSKWCRECGFFDGESFNMTLRLLLKTYILGGDCVLMLDDGLIEDSGKLVIYEPDEIGSTTEDAVRAHFGASARQSLGRVYNPNGRFLGCVVSRSQRGKDVFDPNACYFLARDPDASMFDSPWLMPRNVFRVAQGRGISPLASSLATILDLEDLTGYELAAAKKNSQTLAQVIHETSDSTEDAAVPSAFGEGTDFSGMSEKEIEEAVKTELAANTQTMSLDRITAAGCIYQAMPEGYRAELLDTKHPNPNTQEFVNWLAGRSATPFGLTREFATLAPSGADFRANQLFSARAFQDAQKFLEGICDWVFWRWSLWAVKRGKISPVNFADMSRLDWAWPRMDELDEQAHQNAVEKKLRNMTSTYRDELGPDWKDTLRTVKDEIDWCKANNLPHPAYNMISGGERTGADVPNGDGS